MSELRMPPPPLEEEDWKSWYRRACAPWRNEIKLELWRQRPACERDGCQRSSCDLDEGVVTKGDMRGFSVEQRRIAFAECNLFMLCQTCNRERAHQRDRAFEKSCDRYGEDVVRGWYDSLQLRAPRIEWLPKGS